ncbi:MAG: helix-turn-helix domain-containing protein [Thioploca sp.]|nr:helix-turn-helix domain-containing protein [Thioploca sp.]
MKYNYLQQIESSASFLSTEIFRIYYSRIPKEVDMNATSTHGSQFYPDNQHDTDNHPETQEPAFIQKPLHLVEPHLNPKDNETQTNLSAENLNPELVDTMLTSRPENNIHPIDNPEIEKKEVTAYYDPTEGESVNNLSHSQASHNLEITNNTVASDSAPDHHPQMSGSDSLVHPGEVKVSEEETVPIVAPALTPIALEDDKNEIKFDSLANEVPKEQEDNIATPPEPVKIDHDKIEVEYDSVNPMEIDDNPIKVKFDSLVEPVPEEVDKDRSTLVEPAGIADNQTEIEEERQLEKEALYENTFSLFHKLATPEKDLTSTVEETASAATTPEPELESLNTATMKKAGAYLSSEREKNKLSVQQVADKLYLDVNLIKALEADNYEQLPPPIFIRGYIRNYAKLLEIPAEPLLTAYERSGQAAISTPVITPQLTPKKQTNSSDWRFKAVTYTIIITLMMLMALWQYYPTSISESQETAVNVPEGPAWENFQPLETPPTYPPAITETNPASSLNALSPSEETQPATVTTTSPSEVQPATTEPTATSTEEPPAAPEPQSQSLQIHFKQSVWTRLTDSKGKVLYNQTGKSGEVFSIQEGIPPFYLSVGNEGLQVEYQGTVKNVTAYPKQKNKSKTFIIGGNE